MTLDCIFSCINIFYFTSVDFFQWQVGFEKNNLENISGYMCTRNDTACDGWLKHIVHKVLCHNSYCPQSTVPQFFSLHWSTSGNVYSILVILNLQLSPWLLAPWLRVSLAPWLRGSLAPWLLGSLAPWLLGSLAPWLLGSLAPWIPGSLAPWLLGSLAPWLPGSMAPWILGSLGPWLSGSWTNYCVPKKTIPVNILAHHSNSDSNCPCQSYVWLLLIPFYPWQSYVWLLRITFHPSQSYVWLLLLPFNPCQS